MSKPGDVTDDDMMGEAEAGPKLIDFPEREALEAKLTETEDKLLRAMAEINNIQRRAEQRVTEAHKYSVSKILEEFIPVLDSFEQSQNIVADADEHEVVKNMRAGMLLTLQMMKKVLEKFGVKEINPVNELFNPALHEVMMAQEKADVPANTIIAVMQKGYLLHDRLIRPARVIVAKQAT